MKRILTLVFLSILFLILDNTLMPLIQIRGAYPSLIFIFALCYSIVSGPKEAVAIGVFTGILQDIYFFNGFGINSLTNMIICLLAAHIGKSIFIEKSLLPVVSSFALTLIKGVMIFCILFLMKQYTHIELVLYRGIYNLIIAIFMYRFVYKLSQKEFMKREWKF